MSGVGVGFAELSPGVLSRDMKFMPKRNYDFIVGYRNTLEVKKRWILLLALEPNLCKDQFIVKSCALLRCWCVLNALFLQNVFILSALSQ